MMRSLWSGVSGLKTHQMEMDVIGNNIANVNTTSYKSQATGFTDILYQTVRQGTGAGENTATRNASQVGLGARVGSIYTNITRQGSAVTTNNAFDLMITGDSFFVVTLPDGTQAFTRDGSFTIDGEGNFVTQNNGYICNMIAGEGISGTSSIMNERTKTMAGQATSQAYLKGNINRDDPTLKEGKTVSLEVYGKDGKKYTLKFNFTDAGDNDDSTYGVSLDKILDENGQKVSNSFSEDLVLKYNKHDGTLEGMMPDFKLASTVKETTSTEGVVTATGISLEGKISSKSYTEIVTGKDGKQYELSYGIHESDDPDADYTLELYSARNLEDGILTRFEDKKIDLVYNEDTGALETVGGEKEKAFTFNFDEDLSTMGPITFDLSKTEQPKLNDATSYAYSFGGDAANIGTLNVDFSNTTNYANSNGGTQSTIYAYRGDLQGQYQGYPNGELSGISITNDGSIYGNYTNGQTVKISQIIVAQFSNAMGLEKIGDNLYRASLNSGEPIYMDITEDGGYMSSGFLEGSNIDLAKEFTDMITTQRGFQANSRVITTSDEMLQILKGLKR
jgi:flagellar hook protein FlgE